MGMWDKDKEIGRRIDAVFNINDYLVVWSAQAAGTVPTDLGEARKTRLVVSSVTDVDNRQEVSTLASAIADKVDGATDADFPVVCQLLRVPSGKGNDALVLQYVKDFEPDATADTAA